jgi:tetratricopeptide (TPR) repeat protein
MADNVPWADVPSAAKRARAIGPTMASEETPGDGISPAKRKRLQQCFEHASKQAAQQNYDYATELFTQCVVGDLGNLVYLQSFLGNLRKKYGNNKKGAKLAKFRGSKDWASVKKAKLQKHWQDVLTHGLEVLKINPWDVSTLMAMSTAAEELGFDEVPLVYLKIALDSNSRDPDVNRACGIALRKRKQFDPAIVCWHRVEEAKPGDEEAARQIAELAVEKTIHQGGYEDAKSSRDVASKKQALDDGRRELTAEEKFRRKIAKDPKEMTPYLELAELYFRSDEYDKAEEVLARAHEASGGDQDVRERWEDAQLRNLRYHIREAEAEVHKTGTDEAKKQHDELRWRYNLQSMEVYKHRCERYPNNLPYKYELGLRYQIAGQYNEAIQQFQRARNDPRRKGACMLALGQCFEQIEQHRLAVSHYALAIEEISERDVEQRKKALYLAGTLAIRTSDLDGAEKHLTALAALDFGYKDVSTLLDKITELRNNT